MHITFSPAAVSKLTPYLTDGSKQLKLLHDIEGCGCVVSGVPVLTLIQETTVDDQESNGDPFSFLYEPRHEVFYDPHLRIDYDPARSSFILKSDNQIYTNNLRFIP
ncbi:iron-sulfur cluster biosynthesis family protein [Paenibacillus sp. GSMTC-2017]|nr:iron-sulfur cluster biosynthesis family protein [Paenibacillus sp. GSMTC-2017]